MNCPAGAPALGVARKVEVDTTGGPGFGSEQYRQHDFLRSKEVVLTFDDGPWPSSTPAVLNALARHCTKAIFFPIGKHALWHPEILREVAAGGHTIGGHTWSHANLGAETMSFEKATAEVEKGFSAVRLALGTAPAPFFSVPLLQRPQEHSRLSWHASRRDIFIRYREFRLQDDQIGRGREVGHGQH